MKEIDYIFEQLENNEITINEAKQQVLDLFGVIKTVCDCAIPMPDVNDKYCLKCRLSILH